MAALTETTSNITEFAGKFKVAAVEVDGATGTAGTVTIDEMSTVVAAVATLRADPTADAAFVTTRVDSTTKNKVYCIEWEDDGATACTQNAVDFYLIAIGY